MSITPVLDLEPSFKDLSRCSSIDDGAFKASSRIGFKKSLKGTRLREKMGRKGMKSNVTSSRSISADRKEETFKPSINSNPKVKRNIQDLFQWKYQQEMKYLESQQAKESQFQKELGQLKKRKRNKISEKLTKNRAEEPIEIRLLREGKLRDKRKQQKAKNESKPTSMHQRTRRQRIKSSCGSAIEIIRDSKDSRNETEAYITEPENHKFLISTSCLDTSQFDDKQVSKDKNVPVTDKNAQGRRQTLKNCSTEPDNYFSKTELRKDSLKISNSLDEKPLNLSQIRMSTKRKDMCSKYLTEKRNEIEKLSPQLPSAFEIRKGVTRKYYDKAPEYHVEKFDKLKKSITGTSIPSQDESSGISNNFNGHHATSPTEYWTSDRRIEEQATQNRSLDNSKKKKDKQQSKSLYYQSLFSKVAKKANFGNEEKCQPQISKTVFTPKEYLRTDENINNTRDLNQKFENDLGIGSARNFPPDLFCHPLYAQNRIEKQPETTRNIINDGNQIYYTLTPAEPQQLLIDPKYETTKHNILHQRNQTTTAYAFPYPQNQDRISHGCIISHETLKPVVEVSKGCLNTFTSQSKMKPQIDTDIKSHMINKMLESDQFRTSHHSKANSIDLDCPSAQIHKAMKSKSFIKTRQASL
ncbi:unnamed protein product [Moneuplotes crassus]|uniref:Uncharacterized protein n=1 Tax=Euplotes crassus TaxID=5936 RepID=A0AAD1XKZ4_EUPCR|nr:unnamed protein product [Moneuplotes crassus]